MIDSRLKDLVAATVLLAAATGAWAQNQPHVSLDAEKLGPRPIEQLTGTNIVRSYALAWRDLANALSQNRPELLNEQFIGFAKDQFRERISAQSHSGLHVEIRDQGHRLKAVFYSLDGGIMQLIDDAQIETKVFDGRNLIYSDNAPRRYLVLMTPGADRWYIRSMQSQPGPASSSF